MGCYLRGCSQVFLLLTIVLFGVIVSCSKANADEAAVPKPDAFIKANISLPSGFAMHNYASVVGARSLVLGDDGTVYVGTRKGKVWAIQDPDGDKVAERRIALVSGLTQPNGIAILNGDLYIADIGKLYKISNIARNTRAEAPLIALGTRFPTDLHHGWRYLATGPDDMLYMGIGAPCNVCDESNPLYASIVRYDATGQDIEVFASGVRNSVGFDWHPDSRALWFTDNGRDHMGDDSPPEELNVAPQKGLHFGFPYFHGPGIPDPLFSSGKVAADYVEPKLGVQAHSAILGMRFYTGSMFPAKYRKQIFMAEHGSWNRSSKVGYQVRVAYLKGDQVTHTEVFASGWLNNGVTLGRPVDVLVMPDGSLLISDDYRGVIYRVVYVGDV